MSQRLFLSILTAFSMIFAPFAMASGSAMAAMPGHGQTTADGHCSEKTADGKIDKSGAKPCCVATCAAIAVAPPGRVEPLAFANPLHRPALVQAGASFLAKLPTPPPRSA